MIRNRNPLVTVLDPLPVIGLSGLPQDTSLGPTNLGLNFGVQLSKGEMDFFRGNVFSLPPELSPLASQRLAVHFRVCAGIGCPSKEIVLPGKLATTSSSLSTFASSFARERRIISNSNAALQDILGPHAGASLPGRDGDNSNITLPATRLECFCLDLFATAGCKITGLVGNQRIEPRVDGIEIVDLKPEGMENAIECYARLVLNHGIFPPVAEFISKLAFGLFELPSPNPGDDVQVSGDIQVSASTAVPNNPAIEDDQLKTFINLDKVDLDIVISPSGSGGGGSGGGGGGGGGTITRTVRPRTRTGTFDLTAAISEQAFKEIYGAVIKGFKFVKSGTGSSGIFTASYSVAAHLEGGTIDLRSSGSIVVSELDVKWDTLHVNIGIDIPTVTIGGFCIIPNPFGGCLVRAPSIDLFSGSPDISIPLDLSGIITSEITFSAIPKVFYGVGSGGLSNRWQITLVPTLPIDLDIIDIADTAGDLFHNLIVDAIDNLLGSLGLPDWAIDFIDFVLGGIEGIIRTVLDIPDDVGEFLLDLIGNLGIFQALIDAISQYIAITLFELEDPLEVLPANPVPTPANPVAPLIPVKIPIEFLGIRVNSGGNEMIVEGDVGN
ncbi:hypothetical protein [Candidatus Nitrososphaera evergladensis]|uniref:hypothetical protein n=1 Tax=Candidatus Nitrososphaera evergladensis TaxID=1459637 RepID=UPI0011E5E11A|nr:hypothetical protein [Candidatus Nitrososphaera evergladensis]